GEGGPIVLRHGGLLPGVRTPTAYRVRGSGGRPMASPPNFVFLAHAGDEGYHSLWTHLYCTLPRVLFYANQVVKALFAAIAPTFPSADPLEEFRDVIGNLLVLRDWGDDEQRRVAVSAIRSFFEGYDPSCPTCDVKYGLGVRNLR